MKVDFSQVKELSPIPPGKYASTFSEFKIVPEAKGSGQPYAALTFTINAEEGEYEGRKLWRNFSLQPQSLWALKQALINLGCSSDSFNAGDDLEDLLGSMVGSECILDVGMKQFNGEDRNDVRKVLASDMGGERVF